MSGFAQGLKYPALSGLVSIDADSVIVDGDDIKKAIDELETDISDIEADYVRSDGMTSGRLPVVSDSREISDSKIGVSDLDLTAVTGHTAFRFNTTDNLTRYTIDLGDDDYIKVGNDISSFDTVQYNSYGSIDIICDSNNNSTTQKVVIGHNGTSGSVSEIVTFNESGDVDFHSNNITNLNTINGSNVDDLVYADTDFTATDRLVLTEDTVTGVKESTITESDVSEVITHAVRGEPNVLSGGYIVRTDATTNGAIESTFTPFSSVTDVVNNAVRGYDNLSNNNRITRVSGTGEITESGITLDGSDNVTGVNSLTTNTLSTTGAISAGGTLDMNLNSITDVLTLTTSGAITAGGDLNMSAHSINNTDTISTIGAITSGGNLDMSDNEINNVVTLENTDTGPLRMKTTTGGLLVSADSTSIHFTNHRYFSLYKPMELKGYNSVSLPSHVTEGTLAYDDVNDKVIYWDSTTPANFKTLLDDDDYSGGTDGQMILSSGSGLKNGKINVSDLIFTSDTGYNKFEFRSTDYSTRYSIDIGDDTYMKIGNDYSTPDVIQYHSYGSLQLICDSNDNSSGKSVEIGHGGLGGSFNPLVSFYEMGSIHFHSNDIDDVGRLEVATIAPSSGTDIDFDNNNLVNVSTIEGDGDFNLNAGSSYYQFNSTDNTAKFRIELSSDKYAQFGNMISSGDETQVVSAGDVSIVCNHNNNTAGKKVVIGEGGEKGTETAITTFNDDGKINIHDNEFTNVAKINGSAPSTLHDGEDSGNPVTSTNETLAGNRTKPSSSSATIDIDNSVSEIITCLVGGERDATGFETNELFVTIEKIDIARATPGVDIRFLTPVSTTGSSGQYTMAYDVTTKSAKFHYLIIYKT